ADRRQRLLRPRDRLALHNADGMARRAASRLCHSSALDDPLVCADACGGDTAHLPAARNHAEPRRFLCAVPRHRMALLGPESPRCGGLAATARSRWQPISACPHPERVTSSAPRPVRSQAAQRADVHRKLALPMKPKPLPKPKKARRVSKPDSEVPSGAPAEPQGAPVAVAGIGASAGGLEAFIELLRALPPATGLAFVYIQHLAPTRVSMLPEILRRETRMPVHEIADGHRVEANHVHVMPPGRAATLSGGRLELVDAESHRAVDQFLTSLA